MGWRKHTRNYSKKSTITMLLLIISFAAGLLTVLAPCVLPLLPIIIGGSVTGSGSKWKPYIVTGSLAVSVVLFTLLLKATTALINIPPQTWTTISGGLIILVGLVLVFPVLWESIAGKFNFSGKSNVVLGKAGQKKSIWGDVLIGAALGPVFSSCSPTYFLILATVLPQSFAVGIVYLVAYAIGLSLALLAIALLGQKLISKLGWATNPSGKFRKIIGIIFVVVGLLIITGLEKKIEAELLNTGWVDITKFETLLLEKA